VIEGVAGSARKLEVEISIIVSVDAPSGFATDGNGLRNTESAVAANFNTPDEATFLRRAATMSSAACRA